MDRCGSLLHHPSYRMTTKSSSDWWRSLTAAVYLGASWTSIRTSGSAHKVDVKTTTLFTLYYHWMWTSAQIPSQFTTAKKTLLLDAFYRKIDITDYGRERSNIIGLWTSFYDGHRIAILVFHATYTTTGLMMKRKSGSLAFDNPVRSNQKYIDEMSCQRELAAQRCRCQGPCRSGDYDYYANNVLWVIFHWCPTRDRGDRVTQVSAKF